MLALERFYVCLEGLNLFQFGFTELRPFGFVVEELGVPEE